MFEKRIIAAATIVGLLVAIGLAVAGHFISNTIYNGRYASNVVTVKGFSEREVKADVALWQIGYALAGGNPADLYAQSQAKERMLTDFLIRKGFKKQEIKPGNQDLTDHLANQYGPMKIPENQRYVLMNTITVRTNNVTLVEETKHALSDLIPQGVVLTTNSVDFQFTRLKDIKEAMLRDAMQNARDAAQQFANDSGVKVGAIQSAAQQPFTVVSRDSAPDQNLDNGTPVYIPSPSTIDKKVRVVVTLTYYLER
jgi:uncharacterized protein